MTRIRTLLAGSVVAEALRLDQALSFWGGVDPENGMIIEERHPQHGEMIGGRLMVMPHGKGSSSASSILAETLRRGTGPAGIVLRSPDSILVAGALAARELYGVVCPIVVADHRLETGEIWSLTSRELARLR